MSTIPLLPAPVNLSRDASRSSQRTFKKENHITRKTLGALVNLHGKHNYDYALCPQCKNISESVHQEKPRCIRALDLSKHRTYLHFTSRRFSCEHCKHTFVERLQSIGFRHRQTGRFREVVYQRSLASTHNKVIPKVKTTGRGK